MNKISAFVNISKRTNSMDSRFESEGEGEINYDVAEITTCLELFNSNKHEDLFLFLMNLFIPLSFMTISSYNFY